MYPFPVLVGDIGGTYARFASLAAPGEAPGPPVRVETATHDDPSAALREVCSYLASPPRSAILAVAGRVDGPVVHMTNAPWTIDAGRLGLDLGLERVALLNDFAPVVMACANIDSRDGAQAIGWPVRPGRGARLAIGAGTGLGVAALLPVGPRFLVQPTEAGHIDFGPLDDRDLAIWAHLERAHGRVTAESILSGPGLGRLYRAIAATGGAEVAHTDAKRIVADGLAGTDAVAAETLDRFARYLGRYAGDMALVFGAVGGVFLAGGIAPRLRPVLERGGFRAAFAAKAPFETMLRDIPSLLVTAPDIALRGLALLAAEPDGFIVATHGWMRSGA
jgi:glucokinase